MPAVLRACAPVCGVDIVGATHGSPAFCPRLVLATTDVVGATSAGAWNSGHLRSRFCYFDTLLPLASCRKLDPLRTPRADISVGPFSLGKAVLCLGPAPAKAGAAPDQLEPSPFGRTLRARTSSLLLRCGESGAKYPARSRKADSGANCNHGHGGYIHDNQQLSCE